MKRNLVSKLEQSIPTPCQIPRLKSEVERLELLEPSVPELTELWAVKVEEWRDSLAWESRSWERKKMKRNKTSGRSETESQ